MKNATLKYSIKTITTVINIHFIIFAIGLLNTRLEISMKRDFFLILLAVVTVGGMALWKTVFDSIDDDEETIDEEEQSTSDSKRRHRISSEPFIPTHEWQEVKKDQAIPPVCNVQRYLLMYRDLQFVLILRLARITPNCSTRSPNKQLLQ